jgi:hypothetical protein
VKSSDISAKSFRLPAYSVSHEGGKKCVDNENNRNFVKEVPMIYVNLIINVIIVSEKK